MSRQNSKRSPGELIRPFRDDESGRVLLSRRHPPIFRPTHRRFSPKQRKQWGGCVENELRDSPKSPHPSLEREDSGNSGEGVIEKSRHRRCITRLVSLIFTARSSLFLPVRAVTPAVLVAFASSEITHSDSRDSGNGGVAVVLLWFRHGLVRDLSVPISAVSRC